MDGSTVTTQYGARSKDSTDEENVAMKGTATSSFGTGKRESHDSSAFYERSLYRDLFPAASAVDEPVAIPSPEGWSDHIYCASSESMSDIPDNGVALAFTSPPYNVGKDYEDDLGFQEYLSLIRNVANEVHRVLMPGGRYVINIANLGRKPYIPLHAFFYQIHAGCGFLPMGEVIWRKARGASGNCAWGSWQSAKSPRLRDIHEYLLVFAKSGYSRPDKGTSDIGRDEFMDATLSVWEIPAESARRVGHPAPFPTALAERVLRLFSYVGDVVLDPFNGSGTTCVAAAANDRRYVGYEIDADYCKLAQQRIENV